MGPDDGVRRILRTGVGSVGFYGVAAALWMRSGRYVAEAGVFVRGSTPEIEGLLETVQIEAVEADPAIGLLENKIAEKFGPVKWVNWADAASRPNG